MKSFLIFLSIFLGIQGFSQKNGKITGTLTDAQNQKSIEALLVSLLNAKDSSLVKTSITDSKGYFSFENLVYGSYIVKAGSKIYSTVHSQVLIILGESVNSATGELKLMPVNKNLKEVIVTSKKQFIERKIDKTVINPDALISNAGSTVMEVLEKSPGVTVDKDGNISLKGKSGIIVMLDGKPSYMSGTDLANFLRSLPSSNVEQIEIMTNPSAKYDAAGNSGIINIKTKKNRQKGFNGSVNAAYGQGNFPKTNNSLNLNYRTGKINLFSNISANYRENLQHLDINRRYKNDDNSLNAIFEQNSSAKKIRNNYNTKIGMDYFAGKKTTLGVVLTGYTTPASDKGNNTSYLKSSAGIVDSIVTSSSYEKSTWKSGGANFNMRHAFDSTGRELTADFDYLNYVANRDQLFVNNSYDAQWNKKSAEELRGELPNDIKIYSAKIDYTHPFKSGLKMETGLKYSYVATNNTAGYFNIINGEKLVDYEKTNNFKYNENINAGYINFSKTIKKWGLQTGLRIENTNYEGNQFGNPQRNDSAFKRSYTNAFPTTYISYDANDKNQYGFSFGRRINRPDYEDLNPFLFFIDKYTYGSGNPFLKPMYSNVFEVSHTYRRFLTTTFSYSNTKDLFNETFEQKDYATIVKQGNYGIMNNISLSVNAQVKITKWWTSIIYGEGRYQEFKGQLYGDDLNINATTFLANLNNQFNFKKGWGAELSGFYRTKGVEGQLLIRAMGQMDMGIKKDVLKSKATVKLAVRDMFGPRLTKGEINFQNTEARFRQTNDSRVATISFSYRFGKPIKGLVKRKTGGAGDEQNRIKSGN